MSDDVKQAVEAAVSADVAEVKTFGAKVVAFAKANVKTVVAGVIGAVAGYLYK